MRSSKHLRRAIHFAAALLRIFGHLGLAQIVVFTLLGGLMMGSVAFWHATPDNMELARVILRAHDLSGDVAPCGLATSYDEYLRRQDLLRTVRAETGRPAPGTPLSAEAYQQDLVDMGCPAALERASQ